MNERRRLIGIIEEASTLIERRPERERVGGSEDPSALELGTEAASPAGPEPHPEQTLGSEDATLGLDSRELKRRYAFDIPKSSPEALQAAARMLPAVEVPPHAERELSQQRLELSERAFADTTAPRIGEYALVARFPSSRAADVYLGYKVSNFGFIRRAVVKFTDRARYDYEQVRQKLLDEGRAISFVDHPNIVTILDLAEDELGTYLALEYVAGTDLRRAMVEIGRRNDRMPVEHALYVMLEILRGLAHMHAARGPNGEPLNIIHRDVNPSNILISGDGHVKLTDFGTVLMDGRFQDKTAPGTVKGKVRYLAPEYIAEQTCTRAVDIYGVGVMLFELLTGHPVFLARDETIAMYRIVKEGVPLGELERSGVPAGLRPILERATQRDPAARYPSAGAMIGALEDYMASAGTFVSPTRLSAYLHSHGLLD